MNGREKERVGIESARASTRLRASGTTLRYPGDRRSRRLQAGARTMRLLGLGGLVAFALVAGVKPVGAVVPEEKSAKSVGKNAAESRSPAAKKGEQVATFAGGCFWCTEAVFERLEGVNDVVSGYIGGRIKNPTYKAVTTGRTGHAEAVEVYYDPSTVSYTEMLDVFFKTHDPTTLNRQGADVGTQYRSSIFVHNDTQRAAATTYIEKANRARKFGRPVVTRIEEAGQFYPAEEYHQDYFRRNPNNGYCRAVVARKVYKFESLFGDKSKSGDSAKSQP